MLKKISTISEGFWFIPNPLHHSVCIYCYRQTMKNIFFGGRVKIWQNLFTFLSIFISITIFPFIFVLSANDLSKRRNKLLNFRQNWILQKVKKKFLRKISKNRLNEPKTFCLRQYIIHWTWLIKLVAKIKSILDILYFEAISKPIHLLIFWSRHEWSKGIWSKKVSNKNVRMIESHLIKKTIE